MNGEFIERVNVGDRLKDLTTEQEYRVLQVLSGVATVCLIDEPNHSKLIIRDKYVVDLLTMINTGEMIKVKEPEEAILPEQLSATEQEKYKERLKFVQELQRIYGPTWKGLAGKSSKREFDRLCEDTYFNKRQGRKWINRYIQSGCDRNSLISKKNFENGQSERIGQKKNGRKTSDGNPETGVALDQYTIDSFNRGIEIYKKGVHGTNKHSRTSTLATAYRLMLLERYNELALTGKGEPHIIVPPDQRPTYRQFTYYCTKHLSQETRDKIKTSPRDVLNNNRLLPGDTVRYAQGPMDIVEIDAWDSDIKLLSVTNPNLPVGRPSVYAMIDDYSKMIVGVSVSFDKDSYVGLTNLFLNLVDPIEEQVKSLGLTFNNPVMPTGYLPNIVRTDNGSDFISDDFDRVLNKINVIHETVPAAMGSLKPNIERLWGRIRSLIEQAYENHGAVLKHTENEDEMTAVLNLYEFAQIVYTAAIALNQREMPEYPARAEMLTYKDAFGNPLPFRPDAIWKYGVEKYLAPRTIQNKTQYYIDLMAEGNASLSRSGIKFKGLPYWPADDDNEMLVLLYEQGTKRMKISIHYDPRNMNHIWYIDEHGTHTFSLNIAKTEAIDMVDKTLKEIEEYQKLKRKAAARAKANNVEIDAAVQGAAQGIVDTAVESRPEVKAAGKEIRKNHEVEKINTRKTNAIATRMGEKLSISENTQTVEEPAENKPYDYGDIENIDEYIQEIWTS